MLCGLEFLEHSLAYSHQEFCKLHSGGQQNKNENKKNECGISATKRIVNEESTTECLKSIPQKQKIDECQVDALDVGILNVSFGSCDSIELVDLSHNIFNDQLIESLGINKHWIVIKPYYNI